jgi:hypothetical protein
MAEIHGKLSPEHPESISERSEDLLTSSVFTGFRYVGWRCGLIDWLGESEPVWSAGPSPWAGEIRHVGFCFWPWLDIHREPDLALLILYQDRPALLALVEVKYLSGMSDWEPDERVDEYGRTGNQIADQIKGS